MGHAVEHGDEIPEVDLTQCGTGLDSFRNNIIYINKLPINGKAVMLVM